MPKIDNVLKKLSDLYEFNRWLKGFKLKTEAKKSAKVDPAKSGRAR